MSYNRPPTFTAGTPTLGLIDTTVGGVPSSYGTGTTTCWCGPSIMSDWTDATNGFMQQFCGGSWDSGLSVQFQGASAFIDEDNTIAFVNAMPDSEDYYAFYPATSVRPLECSTIGLFFDMSPSGANQCGAYNSFMCSLSTYPASEWNGNWWDYSIGVYQNSDQFWVTGNVNGEDPTDGLAYGGANTLAGAQAGMFFPTLERLGAATDPCGAFTCGNNVASPDAFVSGDYQEDSSNPCGRSLDSRC